MADKRRWVEGPDGGPWCVMTLGDVPCGYCMGKPGDKACVSCAGAGVIGQRPYAVACGILDRADADWLADRDRLAAEAGALRAALTPFARVRLPDSWPGGCVVDWREAVGKVPGDHSYAHAGYLGIDAQGGPAVDDYRRAALALNGGAT